MMRRVGGSILAAACVVVVVCVFWQEDAEVNVRESTPSATSLKDSLYTQQTSEYEALIQTADTVVPESDNNFGWTDERKAIWTTDSSMLQKTDMSMHAALEKEMNDEASPHWARYLRHKGMAPPAKLGHSWMYRADKEVTGMIQETVTEEGSEPLCDKDVAQHHGYFKLSGGKNKNYFYWLFEAKDNPEPEAAPAPLILWLTGGPGCSSELALFTENGPCSITKDGKSTKPNPFSWNRKAHMVFVDQPAGTGFSYGDGESDIDHKESDVSTDLYHFMQELVKNYPQYHKSPLYIFGESYAGHYVPASGGAILEGNLRHDSEYIALKGVGIGNGLTDPEIQYAYYPQMAYNSPTTPKVVTKAVYEQMVAAVPACTSLIQGCKTDDRKCSQAFVECNANLINPVQETGVNQYDLREPCADPPLCGDYSFVSKYLNSPKVQKTLGVKKTWHTCNFGVNNMFHVDWMHSQAHHIPEMLKNGMRVLIYNGDVDFICNWMGNKAYLLKLNWAGNAGFNAAKDLPWKVNGQEVGLERSHGGLSFLRIHRAGHMVPQDQPAVSMLMTDAFISGKVLVAEQ